MKNIRIHRIAAQFVLFLCCSSSALACQITVSAASSLTKALKEIATHFEQQQHCKAVLNFAASGALVQQLKYGAPIDVLATADQQTMELAQHQNLIDQDSRRNFISNRLVLITPADQQNTAVKYRQQMSSAELLINLTGAQIRHIALGNPASVPAGRYAQSSLQRAGLWQAVSNKIIPALHVRQVLDYVIRGEVEAGFVYASDAQDQQVKLLGVVDTVIPILYPAAVSRLSSNPAAARRFVEFLSSPTAQNVFLNHGFSTNQ